MERLKKLGAWVKEMEMRSDSHSEVLPCTNGSYSYPSLSVNHCVTCRHMHPSPLSTPQIHITLSLCLTAGYPFFDCAKSLYTNSLSSGAVREESVRQSSLRVSWKDELHGTHWSGAFARCAWQVHEGPGAHLVGGSKVEHAALRQHLDLGEEVPDGGARLVDGGDDDALLAGQARHALHHHKRRVRVQPRGRLVQRDDLGRAHAAARDAQPPLLPTADPPHR